jgi:hypothetical protein
MFSPSLKCVHVVDESPRSMQESRPRRVAAHSAPCLRTCLCIIWRERQGRRLVGKVPTAQLELQVLGTKGPWLRQAVTLC